ncbi:MAG: hypothetical protein H7838_13045, partial [Magnetococcus sp. DMHC-8]
MIVVSECVHQAWPRTRAIVDAYLERVGERTWRGRLTQDGLESLRRELTQVATRQTSVAASVGRRQQRFELEWIVGSSRPFGDNGQRSTYHGHAYDRYFDTRSPRPSAFSLLSRLCELAGLWHDLGKAHADFQDKLRRNGHEADTVRHEILSALVFIHAMRQLTQRWQTGQPIDAASVHQAILTAMAALPQIMAPQERVDLMPTDLPMALRLTAWLIATHHRLPDAEMVLQSIPEQGLFTLTWHVQADRLPGNVTLDRRVITDTLVDHTRRLLLDILKTGTGEGLDDGPATTAYGRLALILADRHVSRQGFERSWHDGIRPLSTELCANYQLAAGLAGVDADLQEKHRPAQALAVHLLKVGEYAPVALSDLFDLREWGPSLPTAGLPRLLRAPAPERYRWQNRAVEAVKAQRRPQAGFFGELIAGTGAGKTRAAARLLAATGERLRYSLCLPLRSLTLQAGHDYRRDLGLNTLEVITVIGSGAILDLYQQRHPGHGSESALSDSGLAVDITDTQDRSTLKGKLPDGIWKYVRDDRDAAHFLASPIVVSTIDQLMAVADARRTAHLLPALRLASADLILDEIDGYDATDQIAIGRLVFLAGVFGRKVIIASATLSQPHAEGLFHAYAAGFAAHARFHGLPLQIDVGLFADAGQQATVWAGEEEGSYPRQTTLFRQAMVGELRQRPPVRIGTILPHLPIPASDWNALFESIRTAARTVHQHHHVIEPRTRKRLSSVLVRLAHIRSCVGLARWLAKPNSSNRPTTGWSVITTWKPMLRGCPVEWLRTVR